MDVRLVEFVRLHHIDLLRRTNYQATQFRDEIDEHHLLRQLSTLQLTNEQVVLVNTAVRRIWSCSLFRMIHSND